MDAWMDEYINNHKALYHHTQLWYNYRVELKYSVCYVNIYKAFFFLIVDYIYSKALLSNVEIHMLSVQWN